MHYWVNQGKTYKEEKQGGYLWARKYNSSGNSFFHWENITKLKPGDIVLNYRKGNLVGYCIVQSRFFSATQPEEYGVNVERENEGYMVFSKYFIFSKPISINTVYGKIEQYLPSKYSPLNKANNTEKVKANQGYLYELNNNIAKIVFDLAEIFFDDSKVSENDISKPTTREGLVTSRVGQGEYRHQLLKRWNYKCAVNGLSIKEILIASHIVPWREANDKERIDVENGLLLSPTYDALFDRHLISFGDDGGILLSRSLDKIELSKLGITGLEKKINNLNSKNRKYLKRHRGKLKSI